MGELSVNNDTGTFDWREITSYKKANFIGGGTVF